ncbi:MAG: hypothetical protein AAF602_30150 [Myxococcota bacterium]
MRIGVMVLLTLGVAACDGVEGLSAEQQALQVEELSQEELERFFPAGAPCGEATCGLGEYCCNASCSACVPFGASCTQEVCNPTF